MMHTTSAVAAVQTQPPAQSLWMPSRPTVAEMMNAPERRGPEAEGEEGREPVPPPDEHHGDDDARHNVDEEHGADGLLAHAVEPEIEVHRGGDEQRGRSDESQGHGDSPFHCRLAIATPRSPTADTPLTTNKGRRRFTGRS